MKSFVYRHTKFTEDAEVTTFYILGVPVFKRVIIDTTDSKHRAVGFNVFASDAPCHVDDDEDDAEE